MENESKQRCADKRKSQGAGIMKARKAEGMTAEIRQLKTDRGRDVNGVDGARSIANCTYEPGGQFLSRYCYKTGREPVYA